MQHDWNLRRFEVDQEYVQWEVDTKTYLRLPPGCGSSQQSTVRIETMQAFVVLAVVVDLMVLVDPCVFRLELSGEVLPRCW